MKFPFQFVLGSISAFNADAISRNDIVTNAKYLARDNVLSTV